MVNYCSEGNHARKLNSLVPVSYAEVLTYSCFCELMKRMAANFPHGGAMDQHFANMRSLIQVLHGQVAFKLTPNLSLFCELE